MRIAQVSPLHESVPPGKYGGTERVVSFLTEALVEAGHDVTLYASGDSVTRARLRSVRSCAMRLDPTVWNPLPHHLLMLERVAQESEQYDFVHFHTDFLHFPLARRLRTPHVTTLHGRLDLADLPDLYAEFRDIPLVSISQSQRAPIPWANWIATVHHGLPENLLPWSPKGRGYLAFLGRFTPEKRAEWAIEIARKAGMPLKLAAKIDAGFVEYFEREIEPSFSDPDIEYVGEVDEQGKADLLGGAEGLLLPLDWAEPFGLVLIEALACGTPVIAFRRGSVPEVVRHGITGFIVDSVQEAVQYVPRLREIDRHACRLEFEEHFTAPRMARDYLRLYSKLIGAGRAQDLVA
jgi:glycosyltransferase involved in cell wall biosynthesis